MTITYNEIIKYLCNQHPFITPKNTFTNQHSFPEEFKQILCSTFKRVGITTYDKTGANISLWASILYLLDSNYNKLPLDHELNYLTQYKTNIIIEDQTQMEDIDIISRIVDIADINCFIFDFTTLEIISVYCTVTAPDSKIIAEPLKQSILLAKHHDFYEPIINITDNKLQRCFNYADAVIKKILLHVNKKPETIKSDKIKEIYSTSEILEEKSDTITMHFTKSKLMKMKMNELVEVASSMSIPITKNENDKKKPYGYLKNELVEIILSKK